MFDGHELILSLFTGRKKRKSWNKTREKIYARRKKAKFS